MPNAGFENLSGKYASIHLKQVASLRVPEKKIVKNAMVYKKRNIVSNNQEAQNVQSSSGTTLARYRRLIGMYARRQVYICYRIGSANALVTRTKRQAVFTIQTAARRRVYHWRTKHKMSVRIQSVVRMKLAYKIVLIRRSEYRNDSAKKITRFIRLHNTRWIEKCKAIHVKRMQAAIMFQCAFRCHQAWNEYKRLKQMHPKKALNSASNLIKNLFIRHQYHQNSNRRRSMLHAKRLNGNATRVQCTWRLFLVQKRIIIRIQKRLADELFMRNRVIQLKKMNAALLHEEEPYDEDDEIVEQCSNDPIIEEVPAKPKINTDKFARIIQYQFRKCMARKHTEMQLCRQISSECFKVVHEIIQHIENDYIEQLRMMSARGVLSRFASMYRQNLKFRRRCACATKIQCCIRQRLAANLLTQLRSEFIQKCVIAIDNMPPFYATHMEEVVVQSKASISNKARPYSIVLMMSKSINFDDIDAPPGCIIR